MEIGTLLRKMRDSKRLTTREIADRVGVGHSTYIDWENDKRTPTLKVYVKLAKAFDVCPIELMSYLIGESDQPYTMEEKSSVSELRAVASYLQKHNNLLMESNEEVIKELRDLKEQIKRRL